MVVYHRNVWATGYAPWPAWVLSLTKAVRLLRGKLFLGLSPKLTVMKTATCFLKTYFPAAGNMRKTRFSYFCSKSLAYTCGIKASRLTNWVEFVLIQWGMEEHSYRPLHCWSWISLVITFYILRIVKSFSKTSFQSYQIRVILTN